MLDMKWKSVQVEFKGGIFHFSFFYQLGKIRSDVSEFCCCL